MAIGTSSQTSQAKLIETLARFEDKLDSGRKVKENENIKRFTTFDQLKELPFKQCQKIALLKIRCLTEQDFKELGGKIATREGEAPFEVGDYLAYGVEGEQWPIRKNNFRGYTKVGASDKEGYDFYKSPARIRGSVQINEPFEVQIDKKKLFKR